MLYRISKYALFAMLGLILLASCNKEISDGNLTLYAGNEMNDTSWSTSSSASAAIKRIIDSTAVYQHADSLIGAYGKNITFSKQLQVNIPPNAFINSTGNIVTGLVHIRVMMMEEKAALVRTLKSSIHNSSLLDTEIGIYIIATANDQMLSISPNTQYLIRIGNKENTVKPNMRIYSGEESGAISAQLQMDPLFNWQEAIPNNFQLSIFKQPGNAGSKEIEQYDITTNQLRWILLAKPMINIGNTGKINVILPPNFTNKNSLVFVTTDDHNTTIELKPELNSRSFSSNMVPLQKEINIVSISLIGSQFYYSKLEIKALNNIPVVSLKPQKKSLTDILNELKKL